MSEMINVQNNQVSAEYQTAIKLHAQIMTSGEVAANALFDVCKCLKKMRDEKLYEELGYESFENYCEQMAGIKARQAYTYISTYENLGSTVLQSNAKLGITKLSLLSGMNPIERADMLENGDFENMSVSEIKDLVKKCKDQGEQISLLSGELEEIKSEISEENVNEDNESSYVTNLLNEIDILKMQIAESEPSSENNSKSEISEAEKEKIREELQAELKLKEDDIKKKALEDATKKVEADKEKAVNNAVKAAKKEAETKANEKIKLLEHMAAVADEKAMELQKELDLSDSKSATAKVYINAIQNDFNCLFEIMAEMPEEQQNKFKGACLKLLNAIKKNVEE